MCDGGVLRTCRCWCMRVRCSARLLLPHVDKVHQKDRKIFLLAAANCWPWASR